MADSAMRRWRTNGMFLAFVVASTIFAPGAADARSDQKVVLTCTYGNATENYILDFSTKAVSEHNNTGGWTKQGKITQVTDDKVVMVIGTAEHNTTYTLDRYTLGLSRRQATGTMDNPDLSFGNEPPVPCRRQQKQL